MADPEAARPNGEDSVTLRGLGFFAQFRGRHLPNLLRFLIFLCLAIILILGAIFERETSAEHGALKAAINDQADTQREMTYILTLPQERREALNLAMPDSLRKRIRP